MRLAGSGIARRNDCFVERFERRFWYDCGHFRGIFRHFTGIWSTLFVPDFPQLWAPRGHHPQVSTKRAQKSGS